MARGYLWLDSAKVTTKSLLLRAAAPKLNCQEALAALSKAVESSQLTLPKALAVKSKFSWLLIYVLKYPNKRT